MNDQMRRTIARRKEVVATIQQILIERLNLELHPDELSEDSFLFGFGLGLDSIDVLTLMVGVEDRFGIVIPDGKVSILRSINTIADHVVEVTRNHASQE